jgi:hypothetical protein
MWIWVLSFSLVDDAALCYFGIWPFPFYLVMDAHIGDLHQTLPCFVDRGIPKLICSGCA